MPEAPAAPAQQANLPLPAAPATPPKAAPAVRRFVIPEEAPAAPAASGTATPAQNTGAEAPPAVSDGEVPKEGEQQQPQETQETPEQAAKRQGRRFERRLDKAYRQRAEAEARAKLAEERLAQIQSQDKPAGPKGAPKLEDFDYDLEKYSSAMAQYAKTEATREVTEKQRVAASQAAYQKLVSDWDAKAERGSDKYDDFAEFVGELKRSAQHPFVAAIMQADNGEEIAYHLGKNPKEAERIAKLPLLAQVREIGKLEAKLASEAPKPKAPSKAPAPITPVSGASPESPKVGQDWMDNPATSDKEWFERRNKQVRRR